ncbi:MAG TPA: hypothetical protein VD931_00485 [Baekduia sp.]|nr:hypothetical protein [Baekduia sp.]
MTKLPLGAGAAAGLALGLAPAPAGAADFVVRSVTQPASTALPVTGPLSDLRAASRARVAVPTDWRVLKPLRSGDLRLLTPGGSCRYIVTFRLTSVVADPGDAAAYAEAKLPTPGRNRLLDSGTHGSAAFRVVRPATTARVRIDALRAGVLTRRADVAPAGRAVWSELRATALSRPGDECHSGSYRVRVGPQLGDALAIARTTLTFVKPS